MWSEIRAPQATVEGETNARCAPSGFPAPAGAALPTSRRTASVTRFLATMTSGHLPNGVAEVALGATTLHQLGVYIGSQLRETIGKTSARRLRRSRRCSAW